MDQILLFTLIGLGAGALYAAVAMSVVVSYQGTGVVNFAAGAMGAWGAYTFDELRRTGDLVLPLVVLPERIDLGAGMGTAPALALAVGSSALLGLMAHLLVFDPLRHAPALAKVVASIGVMLTLQALVVMHFTAYARRVEPILPADAVTIAGQSVPRDRLWLSLVVGLLALGITAVLRWTRFGLAVRAGAENERSVAYAGYSPRRLAGATWLVASASVGFLAVLASPTTILTPSQSSLAVVPALGAALLARFKDVWAAAAAGLGIGVTQSVLQFGTTRDWWPDWARNGAVDALPFIVVVIALFLVGDRIPLRGSVAAARLPEVRRPRAGWHTYACMTVLGIGALVFTSGGYRFGVITSMIMAIVALSLVVLTGLVGQISLAQAAFAGTGGFLLSKVGAIPFPVAPLIAALGAAILGVIVGLPALRIRGAQLAVVTLAMAVAVEQFIFRNPSFTAAYGDLVEGPQFLGVDLGVRRGMEVARVEFGIVVLVFLVVACAATAAIIRGALGRRFLAVRANERAAAAVGVDVARAKLTAFAIASFLAGLGGALLGYSRNQLSADSFTALVGVSILAYAYLGGITSISGALLAGLFVPLGVSFVVLDRWLDLSVEAYSLLGGLSLVATAIFNPSGIALATADGVRRLVGGRFDRAGSSVDAPGTATALAATIRPVPTRQVGDVVLQVEELTVTYGGLVAVDGIDLHVRAGEVVGLIGPNGAGKTTCIDAITGFTPSAGTIRVAGRPVANMPPHRRAALGLGRTWQSMELFGDLTVMENLRVAIERPRWSAGATPPPRDEEDLRQLLDRLGLAAVSDRRPNELPLGQQKVAGVARALAATPLVVLLDEPAAGLDTSESRDFGSRLVEVATAGTGVLLVDHDVDLILEVCDRVLVLDFGRLIFEGTAAEVRASESVAAAYLGASQDPEPAEAVR